jgi:hypothetical protein
MLEFVYKFVGLDLYHVASQFAAVRKDSLQKEEKPSVAVKVDDFLIW